MIGKLKTETFWEKLLFNIGLSVANGNFPKFDIDCNACQEEEIFRFLNDDEISMIDALPAEKIKKFENANGLPAGTLKEFKSKAVNVFLISKLYDFCTKTCIVKKAKRLPKGVGIPLPAKVKKNCFFFF